MEGALRWQCYWEPPSLSEIGGGNIMRVLWGIMVLLGLNMVAGLIVAWREKRKGAKSKRG